MTILAPRLALCLLALATLAAVVLPATADPHQRPMGRPNNIETGEETLRQRPKVLEQLYARLATAESEEAAARLAQAIERIWLQSGSDTVNLLMDRAGKAYTESKPDIALNLLERVTKLAPNYTEGWFRRAQVFQAEGDIPRALIDLRRVLAIEPDHFRALETLGQLLKEIDEKKGALQAFERLITVNPHAAVKQVLEELRNEVVGMSH